MLDQIKSNPLIAFFYGMYLLLSTAVTAYQLYHWINTYSSKAE
jgi:hypothetical protein